MRRRMPGHVGKMSRCVHRVVCVLCGVQASAHILFSLVPEEAIFWMRSWPSSVFSSPRVLVSSSLFLDHSWPALIFAEDCNIVSYPLVEIVNRGRLLVGVVWRCRKRAPTAQLPPRASQKFGVGVVTHHFRRYCRFNVVCRGGGQEGRLLVVREMAFVGGVSFPLRKSLWCAAVGQKY